MATTKIVVANQALSHIGSQATIANLTTDKSQEARVCNLFIDVVRKEVLRDFPWPRATKLATLALVEEDPSDEWSYSYRLPVDCITPQRIVTGIDPMENPSERTQFKIYSDSVGGLVWTNQGDAILEYTWDNDNWESFPIDMVRALATKLAYYIAPKLTAGDPFNIMEKVAGLYINALKDAAVNAFNEENFEVQPDTPSIKARE